MRSNHPGDQLVVRLGGLQLGLKGTNVIADALVLKVGPVRLLGIIVFRYAAKLTELILFCWPVGHAEVVLNVALHVFEVVASHFQD